MLTANSCYREVLGKPKTKLRSLARRYSPKILPAKNFSKAIQMLWTELPESYDEISMSEYLYIRYKDIAT